MEFFQRAKVIRLKCSSQTKYLIAHKDEETIKQSRDKNSNNARWSYELVKGKPNVIRLRSCCTWRYLAAVEDPFLLGMTGKKVIQTISQGPIIEWEPIKAGSYIKLKSYIGTTLRANRGPPPYRNSVTHDEPGHWTGTENMTMWIVDIIVIDYQSSEDSTTSTEAVKTTDPASLSCNVADQQVVLYPASISPKDRFSQNGSPTNVGPSSEQHSDSFNKLKSMLAGLDDVNGTVSEDPAQSTTVGIEPLEVKKAKQTIEQLKSTDFNTILSLGQEKKLEKAVGVLIADAKSIGQGEIQSKLINIQKRINSMKNDHESASQDLINFSQFTARRLETRKLKKDAAKASELENVEVETNNRLLQARAKREELLKQLEETENNIKDVEKAQADNVAEVDELILKIEQKSGTLKQMENQEKSWRVKKNEAERLLERIENDWGKIKNMFPDSTLV